MIHPKLLDPNSIVVVGGSDNIHSPGGRVLKNLIEHPFKGKLYVVNPKKNLVQNIQSFQNIENLPKVDLAIIAIAAIFIPETVKILASKKNTKAFIIYSAGFSEKDEIGAKLEKEVKDIIDTCGGTLLGPNNIGLINKNYVGVFTTPIPKLDKNGVDFISGSGATAVFIMEAAQSIGLKFASIITVGNSAQIGVEEVLEYFDFSYTDNESSKVKMLYLESILNPIKFLKHASSLVNKGCKIVAIKGGSSKEGNRAALSHTGAMATEDIFIETLFNKAGVIRCFGRTELIYTAAVLSVKEPKDKNIAIITHAGGPAVMLTDILSKNGLKIPQIKNKRRQDLLNQLFDGSSVENPIDFLATGTADQLSTIIDYCENIFTEIDAMVVIFGSPGLTPVFDAYRVLEEKLKTCKKPIYPILPSVVNAKNEMIQFIGDGNIAFKDEVIFGKAFASTFNHNSVKTIEKSNIKIDKQKIKNLIKTFDNGFLSFESTTKLIQLSGINFIESYEIKNLKELAKINNKLKYPVVLKVIGPLHKTDVGGVMLDIRTKFELENSFEKLMKIDEAKAVLIQPMIKGTELFIGAKKEGDFPSIIMCGLGGIFVEVIKDIQTKMIPIDKKEALEMISSLKSYPILKGIRGKKGINLDAYADIIVKISNLLMIVPEIKELDINPLIAGKNKITAVDVRIRIEN